MKYAHLHTQLYIMYTKQLQVIIDDKAVHKKIFFCFLSKTKSLFRRQRQVSKKKKQTHSVVGQDQNTLPEPYIYSKRKQNMRATTVTQ